MPDLSSDIARVIGAFEEFMQSSKADRNALRESLEASGARTDSLIREVRGDLLERIRELQLQEAQRAKEQAQREYRQDERIGALERWQAESRGRMVAAGGVGGVAGGGLVAAIGELARKWLGVG